MTAFLKAEHVTAVRDTGAAASVEALRLEQERQDAIAAAYAAGLDDGRAQAEAASAAAGPRIAQALEQLAQAARAQQSAAVDESSRAVLASAIDLAEWILRHELSASSRSVLLRLGEAATALLPAPNPRAIVSSHDEVAVRAWAEGRGVDVVVDPHLAAGDAYFDNGTGSVEVTVSAALRIAAEALGVDPARGVQ